MKIIKYKFWPQNRKQAVDSTVEKKVLQSSEAIEDRPKKKALLVGIQDVRDEPPTSPTSARPLSPLSTRFANIENFASAPLKRVKTKRKARKDILKGPHRDVTSMRELLIDIYGYKPEDITVLIDNDLRGHKQPTRDNIMEEMQKLVAGAQASDQFFFHFAGHSGQEETNDLSEEDGKNEYIETCDGKRIQDDTLKEILVENLPSGCFLTAVFDSCHSGSLLDLVHFRCNRVYVPWVNKGNRKTNSLWNSTQRKKAKITMQAVGRLKAQAPWARTSIDQVLASPSDSLNVHDGKNNGGAPVKKKTKLSIVTDDQTQPLERTSTPTPWIDSPNVRECMSPVELYCTGWCRDRLPYFHEESKVQADVISISSARDGQLTWEDKDGTSMTQVMVKILRDDPHPTLEKLMTLVSHEIHRYYVGMHDRNREYKKKFKIANEKAISRGKKQRPAEPVEMNNFQNPELSSERPLDMHRLFYP